MSRKRYVKSSFFWNPEKSPTKKVGEHIACGYSMSTIWTFDNIGNKYSLYRGEDCMKKFCISLRENAANIIDFTKKGIVTASRNTAKITSRFNGMLHFQNKIHTKAC